MKRLSLFLLTLLMCASFNMMSCGGNSADADDNGPALADANGNGIPDIDEELQAASPSHSTQDQNTVSTDSTDETLIEE